MDENTVRKIIREELAYYAKQVALAWGDAGCGNTTNATHELRSSLAHRLDRSADRMTRRAKAPPEKG